jgi:hypothetical protein
MIIWLSKLNSPRNDPCFVSDPMTVNGWPCTMTVFPIEERPGKSAWATSYPRTQTCRAESFSASLNMRPSVKSAVRTRPYSPVVPKM